MKNGWQEQPLTEVCSVLSGLWKGKTKPFQTATVIRNTNFTKDCRLDLEDVAVLDVEVRQLLKRRLLPGDLLLEKSGGGPKQPVGRVVYFDQTNGIYSFSNFTSVLRVKDSSVVSPAYLQRYLYWQYVAGTTEKMQRRSTGIRNLDMASYMAIPVRYPPLSEQRRIVAILDEAFEGIAAAKANAERNLRNAREAYEGWCEETLLGISTASVVKPLGDVCHIQTGKKDVNEGNPNGRYPFFTCASEPTFSDEYSFDAEAILIAGNGNVGQAQYFTGKFEAYQRTYVLTDFRGVTGSYLFRIIDKRLNRRMLRQKLGNTMPYIKMGMLKEFPIPMPDAASQAFVSKRAESIEAEVGRLEQGFDSRLAALDELKASLLHQAFNGQL